jgi:hypothetical protein
LPVSTERGLGILCPHGHHPVLLVVSLLCNLFESGSHKARETPHAQDEDNFEDFDDDKENEVENGPLPPASTPTRQPLGDITVAVTTSSPSVSTRNNMQAAEDGIASPALRSPRVVLGTLRLPPSWDEEDVYATGSSSKVGVGVQDLHLLHRATPLRSSSSCSSYGHAMDFDRPILTVEEATSDGHSVFSHGDCHSADYGDGGVAHRARRETEGSASV